MLLKQLGIGITFTCILPCMIEAQDYVIALNSLLNSFLANPTAASAFEPVTTNPALVSTLEAYVQSLGTETTVGIGTAPPAFVTALPTDAQVLMSNIWSQANSIIAAASETSTIAGSLVTGSSSIIAIPASSVSNPDSQSTTSTPTSSTSTSTGGAAMHGQVATMGFIASSLVLVAAVL